MEKHPLESIIELYLNHQKLSKSTIKTYRICFKYYLLYLKEHHILYAKTSDVIHFRESLRKKGYSTYYIYIYISALKGLYRYARTNQHTFSISSEYSYDIMESIKNERIKPCLKKRILSLEEARQLLTRAKSTRKYLYDYRNYAIIALMITAGLSSHEIIHLKQKDYQVVDGIRVLMIEKRGSTHLDTVYLAAGVVRAIDDYLKRRRKKQNPYLFISQNKLTPEGHLSRVFFYEMFPKVLIKCNLEHTNITPHCLRHTAATLNLLRGGSIDSTKRLLRHERFSSTLVYQEYLEKMNDVSAEALESFILNETSSDLHFWQEFFATP